MIAGSLITIREGLEAFLIIGILLGYLTTINQPQLKVHVWIGAGAALLVSILFAAVFLTLAGHALMALQDLGLLSIGTVTAWDLGWLIPNEALTGRLLHAFIGYEAAPTLLMVFAYLSYVLFFGRKLFLGVRSSVLSR